MKCDLCGTEKEYDQFLMTEYDEILLIVEKSKLGLAIILPMW